MKSKKIQTKQEKKLKKTGQGKQAFIYYKLSTKVDIITEVKMKSEKQNCQDLVLNSESVIHQKSMGNYKNNYGNYYTYKNCKYMEVISIRK